MSGSLGDSTNSKQKSEMDPAMKAATAEAMAAAAGAANTAGNIPWINQQAGINPVMQAAMQQMAGGEAGQTTGFGGWNTGQANQDVMAGMPAQTQTQFGTVVDYGAKVNEILGALPPQIKAQLSRWAGYGDNAEPYKKPDSTQFMTSKQRKKLKKSGAKPV
jgi:hypothetical protein